MNAKNASIPVSLTRPGANPDRVERVAQIRRSGAPGAHAQGTRRQRGRTASRRAAISASSDQR